MFENRAPKLNTIYSDLGFAAKNYLNSHKYILYITYYTDVCM